MQTKGNKSFKQLLNKSVRLIFHVERILLTKQLPTFKKPLIKETEINIICFVFSTLLRSEFHLLCLIRRKRPEAKL